MSIVTDGLTCASVVKISLNSYDILNEYVNNIRKINKRCGVLITHDEAIWIYMEQTTVIIINFSFNRINA